MKKQKKTMQSYNCCRNNERSMNFKNKLPQKANTKWMLQLHSRTRPNRKRERWEGVGVEERTANQNYITKTNLTIKLCASRFKWYVQNVQNTQYYTVLQCIWCVYYFIFVHPAISSAVKFKDMPHEEQNSTFNRMDEETKNERIKRKWRIQKPCGQRKIYELAWVFSSYHLFEFLVSFHQPFFVLLVIFFSRCWFFLLLLLHHPNSEIKFSTTQIPYDCPSHLGIEQCKMTMILSLSYSASLRRHRFG